MVPDASQNQTLGAADLPPVAPQSQTPPVPAPVNPAPAPAPSAGAVSASKQVAFQAKLVLEQYKNDPYKLAQALEQLKATYVAQEFKVVANSTEN